MKAGATLDKGVAAAALKKGGGYGISAFTEKKQKTEKKKSGQVVVGISGMT
jgi:hypothetical protein